MRSQLLCLLALATKLNALEQKPIQYGKGTRPNIVVILTDDQDLHMDSLDYMPLLKKHITDQGTFYKRHYCSTAICCPSRVTLWTGRYSHNTNVTDVFPPYGGYPKFVSQGFNENWLPVWLQAAGYSTYYTGKLFNAHTVDNWNSPHPAGWTSSDFLLDPHTYQYLNATFQRNDQPPVSYKGQYSTDVLAGKAYGLLDEGVESGKPFFLTIAPIAAHSNVDPFSTKPREGEKFKDIRMTEPIAAERHKYLFPDARVPRKANFNPDKPTGASWISHLDILTPEKVAYNDLFYRKRLQALQAVDEIVEGVIKRLTDYNILDNTYVIFTTDNGFHISQHRLNPGKECGFEEDINIPLIIRGPGVPKNEETSIVTAHTDFAPTILEITGAKDGWKDLDGSPIPLDSKGLSTKGRGEHINVEFWGRAIPEGIFRFSLDDGKIVEYGPNNTYKAIRVIGKDYSLYYSVWCTNEHELYDLTTDPHQIHNLYPSINSKSNNNHYEFPQPQPAILNTSLARVVERLDALLMATKSCKGITCREPWAVVHDLISQSHGEKVSTLAEALDERWDPYYQQLIEKVGFSKCELGYLLESEGFQAENIIRRKQREL